MTLITLEEWILGSAPIAQQNLWSSGSLPLQAAAASQSSAALSCTCQEFVRMKLKVIRVQLASLELPNRSHRQVLARARGDRQTGCILSGGGCSPVFTLHQNNLRMDNAAATPGVLKSPWKQIKSLQCTYDIICQVLMENITLYTIIFMDLIKWLLQQQLGAGFH